MKRYGADSDWCEEHDMLKAECIGLRHQPSDYVTAFRSEFLKSDSPQPLGGSACWGARQAAKWALRAPVDEMRTALLAILTAIPDVNDDDAEVRSERD